MPDLAAIDSAVSTLEYQMEKIKERVRDDMEAIPKAKVLYLFPFSLFLFLVLNVLTFSTYAYVLICALFYQIDLVLFVGNSEAYSCL